MHISTSDALAIDGGPRVRDNPVPSWPQFDRDEIEAVAKVLGSGRVNYWTSEVVQSFERAYEQFLGVRHAIALANGTVALELALRAFGVGPGDEVVVPSRTFIATASAAVMCGARPVVADVDRESGCLTAETVQAVLTPATRAVIPVHLAGWPCDMGPIMELAGERDLLVIEDCAQAHGAEYAGRPVGTIGHAGAFSFCQDKIMTTGGEGGLMTTSDEAAWERAWSFKDHGKDHATVFRNDHPPGFRWLHHSFGTNWRMTAMQGAIGEMQLRKLPQWVRLRRRNARRLIDRLAKIPALRVPVPPPHVLHSYYKLYVYLRPDELASGWSQSRIMEAVAAEGVPCFTGTCSEIYLEKAFAPAGAMTSRPIARELGETSLMFLVHPTMGERDVDDVSTAVEKVMSAAVRR